MSTESTPPALPIAATPQPSGKGAVIAYGLLSILSLAIALGTGWWIVGQSDVLGVRFDRAYYVLLAILGMAAALMLFGAMRSTATVRGQHLGVAFDVSGPAALFVLVVAGGFWLTQPSPSFNAKFRLHYAGPEADRSAYDAALPSARLRVFVGFNSQEPSISNQGEVTVWDIPGRFRDGEFGAELVSDRIRLSEPDQAQHLHFRGQDQVIELPAVFKEPPERHADKEQAQGNLREAQLAQEAQTKRAENSHVLKTCLIPIQERLKATKALSDQLRRDHSVRGYGILESYVIQVRKDGRDKHAIMLGLIAENIRYAPTSSPFWKETTARLLLLLYVLSLTSSLSTRAPILFDLRHSLAS